MRSSSYANGHHVKPHWHARAQFIFAVAGTMRVRTPRRAWIVPPSRALWVPSHTVHEIQMYGVVEMRSLYVNIELMLQVKDAALADYCRDFIAAQRAQSTSITVELHHRRATWLNRIRWALAWLVVGVIDYGVTRRLNFGLPDAD